MKLKRLAYLAFTFSIPCFLQAQQAKMNIGIEAGQLNFDVSFKGQPVILSSPLGMNIDNHLLGKEVKNSTVSSGLEASRRKAANSSGMVRAAQTSSAEGHSSSRNTSMAKPCPAG